MTEQLDFALLTRLRAVLADRPTATEAELRGLLEEGDAWARTLQAQLDAAERRLERLTSRDGRLAAIAGELRRVEALRPQLAEVRGLLADLDVRARQLRTEWLSRQSGLGRPS